MHARFVHAVFHGWCFFIGTQTTQSTSSLRKIQTQIIVTITQSPCYQKTYVYKIATISSITYSL